MLIWPECIPCILKMSTNVIRSVASDARQSRHLFSSILALRYFRTIDWNITAPEIIRDIWAILQDETGVSDPFKEMKKELNAIALNIYPEARKHVLLSGNPFQEALKLAVAGNALDVLVHDMPGMRDSFLEKVEGLYLPSVPAGDLEKLVGKAAHIVYLGDNCGEIVFDRLFIEIIKAAFDVKITFITRTRPVLNDATMDDALYVGMEGVAEIMENGIKGPLPGTALASLSGSARSVVMGSDLIISKGGGNYDLLTEELSVKGKISFLLQAKCEPYCATHNVQPGSLIVYNY